MRGTKLLESRPCPKKHKTFVGKIQSYNLRYADLGNTTTNFPFSNETSAILNDSLATDFPFVLLLKFVWMSHFLNFLLSTINDKRNLSSIELRTCLISSFSDSRKTLSTAISMTIPTIFGIISPTVDLETPNIHDNTT
jgi:hypothetical protein